MLVQSAFFCAPLHQGNLDRFFQRHSKFLGGSINAIAEWSSYATFFQGGLRAEGNWRCHGTGVRCHNRLSAVKTETHQRNRWLGENRCIGEALFLALVCLIICTRTAATCSACFELYTGFACLSIHLFFPRMLAVSYCAQFSYSQFWIGNRFGLVPI